MRKALATWVEIANMRISCAVAAHEVAARWLYTAEQLANCGLKCELALRYAIGELERLVRALEYANQALEYLVHRVQSQSH
jgi:hypothetical protein